MKIGGAHPPQCATIIAGQPWGWRASLALFLGCLAAVILLHGNVPIHFLRCETGEWLRIAHLPEAAQGELVRGFWTGSSHGHYTPLIFTAEFFFTKWADTNSFLWLARQLTALALVAAFFYALVRNTALAFSLPLFGAHCIAGGLTIFFIAQPPMQDLVAWPFHIFQLVWMIFMLATMAALLRLIIEPRPRWVWTAAVLSYASMHTLGLGLVTWCGTIVVLAVVLLSTYRESANRFRTLRSPLWWALSALCLAGIAHSVCMYLLMAAPRAQLAPTAPFELGHALGLIALYPVAVLMNSLGILPTFFDGIEYEAMAAATYGLLVIGALIAWCCAQARLAFASEDARPFVRLCVVAFGGVTWIAFVGLFAMREFYEVGALPVDIYKFFVDSRYVVPFSLTLLGPALLVIFTLSARQPKFAAGFFLALGLAAWLAHSHFQKEVRGRVLANNAISHGKAWKAIVDTASQCQAAGLPIPDVPVKTLITFSPDTRLSYFEPILHDALRLPPAERCRFAEWKQCRGTRRDEYDKAAPSLHRVVKLLRITDG